MTICLQWTRLGNLRTWVVLALNLLYVSTRCFFAHGGGDSYLRKLPLVEALKSQICVGFKGLEHIAS